MNGLTPISDDEREDGEIVDDDFEDISDYSIPSSGKSDYPRDLLRPISLSSITDSDNDAYRNRAPERAAYKVPSTHRHCRRSAPQTRRKHREPSLTLLSCNSSASRKRHHKKSRTRSHSTDSSACEEVDRRTLRQLNKAVRIDVDAECKHNTLKDRLKTLIHHPDDEVIIIDDEEHPKDSTIDLDDGMDKEIEELRIQALKSAMLRKHMERKKRKEHQTPNLPAAESHSNKKGQEESKEAPEENEDDLDIMRAMLLASISKKITDDQPSPVVSLPDASPGIDFGSLSKTTSLRGSPVSVENQNVVENAKRSITAPMRIPPVKPLIIQVGAASDSESESENNHAPNVPKIQSSVEELLRKQREQFEAKLAQIVPVPEASAPPPTDNCVDKSILKLLPKSQQQEYILLRRKLLQARHEKQSMASSNGRKRPLLTASKSDEKGDMEKKERSQSKGKYKELAPLLRKIRAELDARRKCEEDIQSLGEQLKQAQIAHSEHQKNYTELLAQMRAARKAIDMRAVNASKPKAHLVAGRIQANQAIANRNQSTVLRHGNQAVWTNKTKVAAPMKQQVAEKKVEKPAVAVQSAALGKAVPVNALRNFSQETGLPCNHDKISAQNIEANVQKSTMHTHSKKDDCIIFDDVDKINQLFGKNHSSAFDIEGDKENARNDSFQESQHHRIETMSYVSPLDNRANVHPNNNPMEMICPYELFGICKDNSCKFNHCA